MRGESVEGLVESQVLERAVWMRLSDAVLADTESQVSDGAHRARDHQRDVARVEVAGERQQGPAPNINIETASTAASAIPNTV